MLIDLTKVEPWQIAGFVAVAAVIAALINALSAFVVALVTAKAAARNEQAKSRRDFRRAIFEELLDTLHKELALIRVTAIEIEGSIDRLEDYDYKARAKEILDRPRAAHTTKVLAVLVADDALLNAFNGFANQGETLDMYARGIVDHEIPTAPNEVRTYAGKTRDGLEKSLSETLTSGVELHMKLEEYIFS